MNNLPIRELALAITKCTNLYHLHLKLVYDDYESIFNTDTIRSSITPELVMFMARIRFFETSGITYMLGVRAPSKQSVYFVSSS